MEYKSTTSRGAMQDHFDYLRTTQSSCIGDKSAANEVENLSRLHKDGGNFLNSQFEVNERFLTALDHLDMGVEKLRKDAILLQERRDYLLMSMDLIKSNDSLQSVNQTDREEILNYIERVNARLGTVHLNVRTVRDQAQQDALSQVNSLIDMMITIGDPVFSRQRCQQYLNACCSSAEKSQARESGNEIDLGPIDKRFESALLGCTLDDQKNIKKRLQALMVYLNKQTISQPSESNCSNHGFVFKSCTQS